MQYDNIIQVKCSNCGKKSDFLLKESIDTLSDPSMKAAAANGDIFAHICPECRNLDMIGYPVLYHDPEEEFMVYLASTNDTLLSNAASGIFLSSEGRNLGYDLRPGKLKHFRAVMTVRQFREKLLIFNEHLDDRIIELIKLVKTAQAKTSDPSVNITEFYFGKKPDGTLAFAVKNDKDEWGETDFSTELYNKLESDFREIIDANSANVIVNFSTAVELYEKKYGSHSDI